MGPFGAAIVTVVMGMVFGVVISLIVVAIVKRPAPEGQTAS
jgi:hypothetical protein